MGEIQARNLTFNSFFSCNLQFVWFSKNASLRASVAKAVFQDIFLDIEASRTSFILSSILITDFKNEGDALCFFQKTFFFFGS